MQVFPLGTASVPKGVVKQEWTCKLKQNKKRVSKCYFSAADRTLTTETNYLPQVFQSDRYKAYTDIH